MLTIIVIDNLSYAPKEMYSCMKTMQANYAKSKLSEEN